MKLGGEVIARKQLNDLYDEVNDNKIVQDKEASSPIWGTSMPLGSIGVGYGWKVRGLYGHLFIGAERDF